MKQYRIIGKTSEEIIQTHEQKREIRKQMAPEFVATYREIIIKVIKSFYDEKSYEELLREHLKEIKEVLSDYTGRLEDVTMMIKNLRKAFDETTNRKTHAERAAQIGRQIAEGIGIDGEGRGINADLAELMIEVHDIGHTPFGHDGEVWISNVLKELGIGQLLHNAEGARRPLYREGFYEEVISKIREQNPNINKWRLQAIEENLWIIFDGVLTHNGEATQKIFVPNTKKTEEDFRKEILACYREKKVQDSKKGGIDKNIFPATIEGCLLRICDFVSYTARDFVDGMREGLIDDVDSEYISRMKSFGITGQVIQEARRTKNYEKIAAAIEQAAIQDVIMHSTSSAIQMSDEMAEKLFNFRKKNNSAIVNYVTRTTENTRLPNAIRELILRGMKELTQCSFIEQIEKKGKGEIPEEIKNKYSSIKNKHTDEIENSPFVSYLEGVTPEEVEFAKKVVAERQETALGVKLSEKEAVAAMLSAHAVANMTDNQLVQVLRGLGLLTDLEVADMNVKYKDIPKGELHNVELSEFMKKTGAKQEADLKAMLLGNDTNDGGNNR